MIIENLRLTNGNSYNTLTFLGTKGDLEFKILTEDSISFMYSDTDKPARELHVNGRFIVSYENTDSIVDPSIVDYRDIPTEGTNIIIFPGPKKKPEPLILYPFFN